MTTPDPADDPRATHPRVCQKHRTNGDPCRAYAIKGADYCDAHGGRTPGGKAAAQKRLLAAADAFAAVLVEIATDPKVPYSDRRQAARDGLDRLGMSPRQHVEMDVTTHDGDSALDQLLTEFLDRAPATDADHG